MYPDFLIIYSEKEGETISSLSPFVVHKPIMGFAGEPKNIKNLWSGDHLIQCAEESHEKSILQMKTFCGLKCSVTPHSSLNTSRVLLAFLPWEKSQVMISRQAWLNRELRMFVESLYVVMVS